MARMNFKNTFGSQINTGGTGLDLQRVDLFKVTLVLPAAIGLDWTENVEFALEKFPFPERSREMIPVKYMQQTNFVIGGDTPMPAVEIPVRYAFAQRTAEALEKWFWLVANPRTGGVGLTSEVKSKGFFRHMVPNMQKQINDLRGDASPGESTLKDGLVWQLEGCIIKGLKPADGDMTQSGYVNLAFNLQIDRFYPQDLNRMQVV
jgi:hypothetical protein